jgi:outer membrane protein assembly factor BamB
MLDLRPHLLHRPIPMRRFSALMLRPLARSLSCMALAVAAAPLATAAQEAAPARPHRSDLAQGAARALEDGTLWLAPGESRTLLNADHGVERPPSRRSARDAQDARPAVRSFSPDPRASANARTRDRAVRAMTMMMLGGGAQWSNFGGNAQRNGRSGAAGPTAPDLLWSNSSDFSIISWHPVISDGRVYAIRQAGFPGAAANDVLLALDLETGAELWRTVVPYGGNSATEWIAYVAGANDGRVYAARGGSGRQTPVYAFDGATGALVWASAHLTLAGPQDGVVFTANGDLVVGDEQRLARLRGSDGSTVWSINRQCSVSGNCGAAIGPDGVFIDAPSPDASFSQSIAKYDLETGAFLYRTPPMVGATVQNAPFLSLDGSTVYLARTQNNTATDFLFAFADTGTALELRWQRPIRWTTSHEHGLAADGSIYTFLQNNEFVRLDPNTGDVVASAGALSPLAPAISPRTAVGTNGTVFVSNGWANNPALEGRVWAFDAGLSTNLFTLTLDRPNSGGPSLGAHDTLVVADRVGIRAYRSATPPCAGDLDGNGAVDAADLAALLSAWGGAGAADLDGSGAVDAADLAALLSAWGGCS